MKDFVKDNNSFVILTCEWYLFQWLNAKGRIADKQEYSGVNAREG